MSTEEIKKGEMATFFSRQTQLQLIGGLVIRRIIVQSVLMCTRLTTVHEMTPLPSLCERPSNTHYLYESVHRQTNKTDTHGQMEGQDRKHYLDS